MSYENIGVDLGHRFLKISLLEMEEEENYIVDYEKYYIDKDLSLREYFKLVDDSIKEFYNSNNIKKANLHFSLPPDKENVYISIHKMNMIDEVLVEDIVFNEIEAYIELDRRKFKHIYKVVAREEEENQMKVLSALVNKKLIESILNLGNRNRIIKNIEPQLYVPIDIIKGNQLLIDFGYDSTRIYLYIDGKLNDVDIIPMGNRKYIDVVKEMFTPINRDEAEDILKNSQVLSTINQEETDQIINGDRNFRELFEEITSLTKDLAESLKRIVRVMELSNQIVLGDIIYTGGMGNIKNLSAFISKEMDIEFKPFNFYNIGNSTFTIKEKDDEEVIDQLSDYGSVVKDYLDDLEKQVQLSDGAGQKKSKELQAYMFSIMATVNTDSDFNFIKDKRFYLDRTAVLIGIICGSIILHSGMIFLNKKYERKIGLGNTYLSDLSGKNSELESEIDSLYYNIDRNKTIINRVENLEAKKKWISDILYVLPLETPANTVLTNISIEPGHAVVTGYSEDYSSVGYLAIALEDYGEVTITEGR